MPFPLQIQRLGRALTKRLGIQGNVFLTLVEDLQAVIPLLDGPEGFFVKGEELRGGTMEQVAAAGFLSRIALLNPSYSGKLVVVTSVRPWVAITSELEFAVSPVDAALLPGTVAGRARDTRWGVPAPPQQAVRIAADTPGAVGGTSISRSVCVAGSGPAANDLVPPGEAVILAPDTQLSLTTRNVNTFLSATWWWREYSPAPQELT